MVAIIKTQILKVIKMELNNLENKLENKFLQELSAQSNEVFYLTKDEKNLIPTVNSGIFKCVIDSAIEKNFANGSRNINCSIIAFKGEEYTKDNIIGKFSLLFSNDPTSKFYIRTRELAYHLGCADDQGNVNFIESVMQKKVVLNGLTGYEDVLDANGVQLKKFDNVTGIPFLACIARKQDYVNETSGVASANYSCFGVFGTDKKSVREKILTKLGKLPKNAKGEDDIVDCKKAYNAVLSKCKKEGLPIDNPVNMPVVVFEKVENSPFVQKEIPIKEEPTMQEEEYEDIPF